MTENKEEKPHSFFGGEAKVSMIYNDSFKTRPDIMFKHTKWRFDPAIVEVVKNPIPAQKSTPQNF